MDANLRKVEVGLAVGVSAIYGFGQAANEPQTWQVVDNDDGYARRFEGHELNDFGYHGILRHFGLAQYAEQLPLETVRGMSWDELANWRPALAH